MLNKCFLQGRLTKDAELRYTQSGKEVASFSVAVDRGRDNGADFINCVAWNKTALFVDKYFHKGDMILLEGRIATRHYEDRNGDKRTVFEVVVDNVNFCGSKKSESNNASSYTPEQYAQDYSPSGFYDLPNNNEKLPF